MDDLHPAPGQEARLRVPLLRDHAMKRLVVILALLAALAAGCGSSNNSDTSMDKFGQSAAQAHLSEIKVQISDALDSGGNLDGLTSRYVSAVESARGVLSDGELRGDLGKVADMVRDQCGSCADRLNDEKSSIG
jgi:hypothetical protein